MHAAAYWYNKINWWNKQDQVWDIRMLIACPLPRGHESLIIKYWFLAITILILERFQQTTLENWILFDRVYLPMFLVQKE